MASPVGARSVAHRPSADPALQSVGPAPASTRAPDNAAGLVPVSRDSGRRTGNLHRPKRYSRRLRRVFYLSAQTSIIRDGPNRDFYLKKRGEGCKHAQAVIALARRRAGALWALLRDHRVFTPAPPLAQVA